MQKRLTWLAAASLAVGGVGLVVSAEDRATDQPQTGQQQPGQHTGMGQMPAGIQKADRIDKDGIAKTLGKATSAAINKGKWNDLVSLLSSEDSKRLQDLANQGRDATFGGLVQQIYNDWNAKYSENFDFAYTKAFGTDYNAVTIVQGEVQNPALLSNWPVQNTSGQQPEKQPEKQPQPQPGQQPGAQDIKQGSEVAIVTFPASHGMPEVNVSLVSEGGAWHIDIPNNIDGNRLKTLLQAHLTKFDQMKAQWPADKNEGYRAAAHAVLAALYDVSGTGGGEMHKGGTDTGTTGGQDQK